MIHSQRDAFVRIEAAKRMYQSASEPKRIHFVDAQSHWYHENHEGFFRVLDKELLWVRKNTP